MNKKHLQKKKAIELLAFILLVIIFLTIAIVFFGCRTLGVGYYKDLKRIAEQNGVDVNLVMAICKTESSFRPKAVSSAGAVGLMQIIPETAQWIAESHNIDYKYDYLFNADYNAKIGCLYLVYLQQKFSFEWTIVAYNSGENMARKWINENIGLDNIPYAETRTYVQKVLSNYKYYKILFFG